MSEHMTHQDRISRPPIYVAEPPRLPTRDPSRRLLGGAVVAVLSIGAIVAASRFERKLPAPATGPGTVSVSGSAISISQGAPQWDVIRLGRAEPASEHWTDPLPAYVRVDETRAARVGAPLGGRVQQVFAELGQTVAAGTPLFSVASPDLAALRADMDKSKVELEAAKT